MVTIAEQLTSLAETKTAIKNAITARGVSVSDSDTFRSYADKIGNISETVSKVKYGASIDLLLGNINENGELQRVTEQFDLVFDGVKTIKDTTALRFRFSGTPNLRYVCMPDLETLTASNAMAYTFQNSSCQRFYCPKLQTINGTTTMHSLFQGGKIEYFDMSALKTANGTLSLGNVFNNNPLKSAYFYSLTTISAKALGYKTGSAIFQNCKSMEEIHFRMDAQAAVESSESYSFKFGATNATIYFDLVGKITVDGVEYARKEVDTIRVDWERVWVAWESTGGNIIYTSASGEPAVGTAVYSDAGITQVGTVSGVA